MSPAVEAVAIRPVGNAGNLRAFVSIKIDDIVIHDCRIIQQSGQCAWVSMPQVEYTTSDGERKFSAIVELSEPLRRDVSQVVLTAWERGQR